MAEKEKEKEREKEKDEAENKIKKEEKERGSSKERRRDRSRDRDRDRYFFEFIKYYCCITLKMFQKCTYLLLVEKEVDHEIDTETVTDRAAKDDLLRDRLVKILLRTTGKICPRLK